MDRAEIRSRSPRAPRATQTVAPAPELSGPTCFSQMAAVDAAVEVMWQECREFEDALEGDEGDEYEEYEKYEFVG
eukprot:8342062-Pyramimonas_sp.AAC.1